MYLSEFSIVVKHLNSNIGGSVISNVYRSMGGTLIKLFGSNVKGIYFNTKEKVIFPVNDISIYKRDPITKIEEGLRANLKGRISSVCLLEQFGKVVSIKIGTSDMIIPFFKGKGVHITDFQGKVIWQENKDISMAFLKKPMEHIEPETEDATQFENIFFNDAAKKEDERKKLYLDKKLKSLEKLKEKLETDLEEHRKMSVKFFDAAQTIKANLYSMDGNLRKKSLKLFSLSGEETEIFLDPQKTIIENLNFFFRKASKHKNGIVETGKRIEMTAGQIAALKNGTFDIDEPFSDGGLSNKKGKNVHSPFHQYKSSEGRIYLVGKGAKDNDELTFKIASPHDMWFHAKDLSGSHVVMKIDKNEVPGRNDILNGAILALYYSKAKKALQGDVWVARRKNIVKKKGMAPGKVLVRKGDVRYVNAGKFPDGLIKV